MNNRLQEAYDAVLAAQKTVNEQLTGTNFAFQLNYLNTNFKQILSRLTFMGASPSNEVNATTDSTALFPPITNFMGRKIKQQEKVAHETEPAKESKTAKREQYKKDVEELLDIFLSLDKDDILKKYSGTPYEKILRGLAKVVGVADYSTALITEAFVGEVRIGVELYFEEEAARKSVTSLKEEGDSALKVEGETEAGSESKLDGDSEDKTEPDPSSKEENLTENLDNPTESENLVEEKPDEVSKVEKPKVTRRR